jgi:uncharacterized protein GlcG (DUF336 family)
VNVLVRRAMMVSLIMVGLQVSAAEDNLLIQKVLPLRLELEAAQAVIQACAAKQYHVSVVIVDLAGNTKLVLVSDGGNYANADSARRKAYTAVMFRQPTSKLVEMMAANPGAPPPGDGNPTMLFLWGGIPIVAQGEVVGAIGVGGSPSHQDAECAQAGVDKLQSILH